MPSVKSPRKPRFAYNPKLAKEIAKKALSEEQTAEEQAKALVQLPEKDFRQVLLGVMLGDI